MKSTSAWLDKLKLRYSYGKIGDDGGLSQRWIYATQWDYGGNNGGQLPISQYWPSNAAQRSPYIMYNEKTVGNPDIQWETALKSNLGLEVSVLKNMLSANFEYFTEDRTNILLAGSSRILPAYLGTDAPTANVGRVTKKGYEIELRFNKNINDWHLWAETSMTHAVDKIMEKEEPELLDPHLLAKRFPDWSGENIDINRLYSNLGSGLWQVLPIPATIFKSYPEIIIFLISMPMGLLIRPKTLPLMAIPIARKTTTACRWVSITRAGV